MTLADAKQLSIGTAIYVIPKNDIDTLCQIREIFESTYEFDGIETRKEDDENPERRLGKVRLRWTRASLSGWRGWYDARDIEADGNVAIARNERMIHKLHLIKGCAYDEENLKKFRRYGSAREALYAESIRMKLEEFAKSSALLGRTS